MKRGRKPGVAKETHRIYLPEDLSLEVQLRLLNPSRAKMRYGSFSLLIERLLRDWLSAEQASAALDSGVNPGDNGHVITPQEHPHEPAS